MSGNEALAVLRGGDLDTVSFVRDYVEFRIDYHVLRALATPVVELADGGRFRFPEPGSRDALCRLISTTVESAEELGSAEAGDLRIEVRVDAGHRLTIRFDDDPDIYGEWAHLVPADDRGELQLPEMFVWV